MRFIYLKPTVNLSFLGFPSLFKLVDMTLADINKSRFNKSNYRPVSLLSNISEIFEKRVHRKISDYLEIPVWFLETIHHARLSLDLVKICKKAINKGKKYDRLLTDLSKAFDSLPK